MPQHNALRHLSCCKRNKIVFYVKFTSSTKIFYLGLTDKLFSEFFQNKLNRVPLYMVLDKFLKPCIYIKNIGSPGRVADVIAEIV